MSVIVKGLSKLGNINNPLVRDFTTSAEKRLKQIANDVDDSDDWFDTNITDRFGR